MSGVEERKMDVVGKQNVFTSQERKAQGKEPIKTCKAGVPAQGAFLDILKILGLDETYPSKISLLDAMVIKKISGNPKLVDLPWMIIHKILMIDYNARDQRLSDVEESGKEDRHDGGDDYGLDEFLNETQSANKGTLLNTLDVLVAIFTCCDNFLKQRLAQKLFMCKLAIPFMYPLGSEDTLMMSLWALRTITVQWHDTEHEEAMETPVTNKPFPLVTFVRLGKPSKLSKSKLMNDILRDDSHNTFFNHDCNNGTVARRLTDGLVECSWFVAAGKEKEHLPGTTMFLNLRGDASLMTKQMQFLQEISSVVFVIVSARDLARTRNTKTCQQILQSDAKVILLISGNNKQERKACIDAVGRHFLKWVHIISSSTTDGIKKNADELKTESRRILKEVISKCSGTVIEECVLSAQEKGILIDEYEDDACVEGKILAKKVLSHMKGKRIVDCKDLLLPLQGDDWIKYCKLQKEQHRLIEKSSHKSTAYRADKIKQDMELLRKKQVQICHNRLTPFIEDFMSSLQKNTDVVLYFLKWMNIILDELSGAYLPRLRGQYHELWTKFQKAKNAQNEDDMKDLKPKVDDAENQLASASLGLEHLFREMGQIYEAVKGRGKIGKDTKVIVEDLPEIAAKLLMKGIPLELVDGDASSVPISWVTAVLNKLESIIGEKRLFVLSVLGIQSSGKSTLLNTMFGLQFAVSAGRCTRGAYMQLIRVDKDAELPFHYIVVVDTEGLRAPELEQLKYDHDNELATLVIGLGDVTMINIKGENTAEMKNILQIVVHAFLRMNLVSKSIKDHRTCIFVHQNVPADNAKELMMHGCQKLQEGLDDMAKEAAHSENIANVHSFSQIINFDVQKHVWYFSDLWQGDPPMAPANHGYSEKVETVRSNLLGEIAKGQTTFLTTSDLCIRLADLWNGVLADDFVFSFRNSLELKAYNSLQSNYYTIECEFQNDLRSWLSNAETRLNTCETIEYLENCVEYLISDHSKTVDEKAEKMKTCLMNYFDQSNLKEIIIQWQQSKLNQIEIAVEQLKREGKTDLLSITEARRVEILQIPKWSEHKKYIMTKAVKLADKLKGQKVTDADLQKQFNAMWVPMVQELATNREHKELKMDVVMLEILRDRFHAHGVILRDELMNNALNIPLKQVLLEGTITVEDVRNEHISLKTTWLKNIKASLTGDISPELQAKHMTVALTDNILQEISIYLKDLSKHDMIFQKTHATFVIQTLKEKIDTHNQKARESADCIFMIHAKYEVKLAVHVSRHCVREFSKMQSKYNKKHGVKAKLEEYKAEAWSLFEDMVKQRTDEVIVGHRVCTTLKGIIHKTVKKKTPRDCVDEIKLDFQMTKYYLIMKIMDDLARKGKFEYYASYIRNAKEFALWWITKYTNEKMFSRQDGSGMSRYAEITKGHIVRIIQFIVRSVEHATSEVEGQTDTRMALWIEKFCKRVSNEIAVPASILNHLGDQHVGDFRNLQRIILEQLGEIQDNMVRTFANENEYSIDWDGTPPPQTIIDEIWGCPEQCPFCKEPCADTTAGHYSSSGRSHICMQHRPKGIGGIHWYKDCVIDGINYYKDQLQYESCNYSVQWKTIDFSCAACRFKCREYGKCSCLSTGTIGVWHSYLEYKTYLPAWDIPPDSTNSVSKYWMWFMATYKSQVEDMYNKKLPDLPGSWRLISKEDALIDLRKYHN